MNRRPPALVFVILLCLLPGVAIPQEAEPVAEISLAEGTSEVSLPEIGWRRAVVGRRLPEESVVATWLDSRVVLTRGESTATLGAVSHIAVLGTDAGRLVLRLDAGELQVTSTEGIIVELPATEARIVANGATEFALTTRSLSVAAGDVAVELPEVGISTVSAGESISLVPHDFEPIFRLQPR